MPTDTGPVTPLSRGERMARNVGIGCVMSVGGFFGGGMIGVLIAKIVGTVRACPPPEGVPACDWPVYAVIGMGVGLLTLPSVVLWRLNHK